MLEVGAADLDVHHTLLRHMHRLHHSTSFLKELRLIGAAADRAAHAPSSSAPCQVLTWRGLIHAIVAKAALPVVEPSPPTIPRRAEPIVRAYSRTASTRKKVSTLLIYG